jgi:hypothetical protein
MKIEKFKETVCTEMSMSRDGNVAINHKDGNVVQKKCKNSLKIFFILKVLKKSAVMMKTLMMEEEEPCLEQIKQCLVETQVGINGSWLKEKIKEKITEIMTSKNKIKITKKKNDH